MMRLVRDDEYLFPEHEYPSDSGLREARDAGLALVELAGAVQQSREQPCGEFWSTSGHARRAVAVLASPLGGREAVDPYGVRLPVAHATALLETPAPWRLVREEYPGGSAWAWASACSNRVAEVTVRQDAAALVEADWTTPSFAPRLLARPLVRGRAAVLLTFRGRRTTTTSSAGRRPTAE
jgi:hypothetical protein